MSSPEQSGAVDGQVLAHRTRRHLSLFILPDEVSPEQAASPLPGKVVLGPVEAEDTGRSQLTEREREVMTLVASGLQTADMAERLFLSSETVKTHVQNAMSKLGSRTRAGAVAVALVTGQISWDV